MPTRLIGIDTRRWKSLRKIFAMDEAVEAFLPASRTVSAPSSLEDLAEAKLLSLNIACDQVTAAATLSNSCMRKAMGWRKEIHEAGVPHMTIRARFSQADVTRAYRGAVKAGMLVQRIEICPATGRILIVAGPPLASNMSSGPNEWDEVLYDRD